MTDEDRQASDYVADMVKKVRRQRGWSTQELADLCAMAGAPQITSAVLMNIESGRPGPDGRRKRFITLEELLVLGYALGVAPVDLLVPGDAPDNQSYSLTPEITVSVGRARAWVGGQGFLSPPITPSDLARALQWMPPARAEAAMREWLTPEDRQWLAEAEKDQEEGGPHGGSDQED